MEGADVRSLYYRCLHLGGSELSFKKGRSYRAGLVQVALRNIMG